VAVAQSLPLAIILIGDYKRKQLPHSQSEFGLADDKKGAINVAKVE
jgi:hypothetical protein